MFGDVSLLNKTQSWNEEPVGRVNVHSPGTDWWPTITNYDFYISFSKLHVECDGELILSSFLSC